MPLAHFDLWPLDYVGLIRGSAQALCACNRLVATGSKGIVTYPQPWARPCGVSVPKRVACLTCSRHSNERKPFGACTWFRSATVFRHMHCYQP